MKKIDKEYQAGSLDRAEKGGEVQGSPKYVSIAFEDSEERCRYFFSLKLSLEQLFWIIFVLYPGLLQNVSFCGVSHFLTKTVKNSSIYII